MPIVRLFVLPSTLIFTDESPPTRLDFGSAHTATSGLVTLRASTSREPRTLRLCLERVALHADLVMLARLSVALARARSVPLAA
jgi:hypothetical protein